jgi:hypothetical protein
MRKAEFHSVGVVQGWLVYGEERGWMFDWAEHDRRRTAEEIIRRRSERRFHAIMLAAAVVSLMSIGAMVWLPPGRHGCAARGTNHAQCLELCREA